MSVINDALTAMFATDVAEDGVYTPPGVGQLPVDVRVITNFEDAETDFGATRIQSETARFEIQISSMAQAPVKGGTLVVGGITHVITAPPEKIDPNGLIWKISAPPQ